MEKKELLFKLGYKIKYERNKRNISQQELAEMANVSISTVSTTELGKTDMKFSNLTAIATVLGLNLGDFSDFKL